MSRKKRKYEMNIPDADKFIGNLKYKDIKRECVIRGMEFDKVIEGTIPKLVNWLRNHFPDTIHFELLDAFDTYQEELIRQVMESRGEDFTVLLHPTLRLGYIAENDAEGNIIKRKRVRTIVKRKKKKRERTNDGIFKGTKKAFTFELQQKGLSKEEVIKKVMTQFPDASEKSIGIWYNKSRKLHKIKIE